MPGRIRSFVALGLPEPHLEALARHLEECARLAPAYRWAEPDGLHLTLRFLGSLEPAALEAVRGELGAVRSAPFALALGGRGTFGPRSSPRVVWVGVSVGQDACAMLARRIEDACVRACLEPDPRPFRAHVTLARARGEGDRLPELPPVPPLAPWTVEDFVLYESRLQQQPRYVALRRYGL